MSTPKAAKQAPRKPAKASNDVNQNAFRLVQEAVGLAPRTAPPTPKAKNEAAVLLGRLGGAKGGKARAAALSPAKRKAIAKKAAKSRWANKA